MEQSRGKGGGVGVRIVVQVRGIGWCLSNGNADDVLLLPILCLRLPPKNSYVLVLRLIRILAPIRTMLIVRRLMYASACAHVVAGRVLTWRCARRARGCAGWQHSAPLCRGEGPHGGGESAHRGGRVRRPTAGGEEGGIGGRAGGKGSGQGGQEGQGAAFALACCWV